MTASTELTWTLPHIVAGVMVLSLNAYVLLGGADFGGGVWDFFARGSKRDEQRALIAEAIGPIWEANHVWLILVVVLLFSCFPKAFAHLATELHVPITIMLVGVVLRGSAFTFRTYDSKQDDVQRRWGRVFSIASLLTPIIQGVCLGTVASGGVPMRTPQQAAALTFVERFVQPWFSSVFPWAVGMLTLLITAAATLAVARVENRMLFDGLTRGGTAMVMHAVTALAAATSLWALASRRFQIARLAAAAQASFILWGWAWTQFPWLLPPDRTITSLAAPRITLQFILGALGAGTVILLPSFVYLFRVFKRGETVFDEGHA
ncbi:cytochrome d ubiquinol oxidase subunit II [Gemmatimonas sp.]